MANEHCAICDKELDDQYLFRSGDLKKVCCECVAKEVYPEKAKKRQLEISYKRLAYRAFQSQYRPDDVLDDARVEINMDNYNLVEQIMFNERG